MQRRRGFKALIVPGLLLMATAILRAGEAPVPPASELRRMVGVYAAYQALPPLEKAEAKRPVFDHAPLTGEEAVQWRRALWQAWLEHLRAPPVLPKPSGLNYPTYWNKTPGVQRGYVQADYWETETTKTNLTMRFGAVTFGAKPEKGWPVYINLHAGGIPASENDRSWVIAMNQYPIKQGLYVCPRSVVDMIESWYDPRSQVLLEQLIAELPTTWEIDPNRVYLMGYSMGGWGTFHLGPCMPDRWAAVAASAGGGFTGARGRCAPDNLRNVPMLIQVGAEDRDYGRYPLSKAFAEALRAFHGKDPAGYMVEFKEHPGKGHQINDRDTPQWLSKHTRDPIPMRVVWQQPILPLDEGRVDLAQIVSENDGFREYLRHRSYWLRNETPMPFQRVVVSRDGNTFRIEQSKHIDRLTILLDDRMADLDQPVRVVAGDKELARVVVNRTVTALVASLVEYRDPELMFCADLTVQVP